MILASFWKRVIPDKRMGVFLFLLVALAVMTTGLLYFNSYTVQFRQNVADRLSAISLLKSYEIESYRSEWKYDGFMIMQNPIFTSLIVGYLKNGGNKELLLTRFRSLILRNEYKEVWLLNKDGIIVLSTKAEMVGVRWEGNPGFRVKEAMSSNVPRIFDFYLDASDGKPYLAIMVPIGEDGVKSGLLAIKIDPSIHLYPFIQLWPDASKTAETLLVRRDGNDALHLTPLRFEPEAALKRRVPLTVTSRPAVMAVLGKTGAVEGIDYRGNRVVGDIRAIPDSPWFLISRMDQSEAFEPLYAQLVFLFLVAACIIAALAAATVYILLSQKLGFDREAVKNANALIESEKKFRLLFDNLTAGFALHEIILDTSGTPVDYRFLQVNSEFERLTGLEAKKILGKTVREVLPGIEKSWIDKYGAVALSGVSVKFENYSKEIGKYFEILAYSPEYLEFAVLVTDITERKNASDAIRVSEERYRRITEGITGYLYTVRMENGRAIETIHSEACKAITGYSPGDFRNNTSLWFEMIYADDKPRFLLELERLYGNEPVSPVLHRINRKDGEIRWVVNTIIPHLDANGILTSYDGVINDITERKTAEINLQLTNSNMDSLWKLAVVKDATFEDICDHILEQIVRITSSSFGFYGFITRDEGAMDIYSWSGDAMKECALMDKPGHFPVAAAGVWAEAIRSRKPFVMNDYSENNQAKRGFPAGHVPIFRLMVIPIVKDGKVISVAAVANKESTYGEKDIMLLSMFMEGVEIILERKRMEDTIAENNANLEKTVIERTADLTRLNEELVAFAYSVSHDLRAPLRAIDGFSKFLQDDYGDRVDEEGNRLIRVIRENVSKMDALITDILSLSRVTQTELRVSNVRMRDLAESVWNDCAQAGLCDGFDFELGDLPDVKGDKNLLKQVYVNLISNAIKYSAKSAVKRVVIGAEEKDGRTSYFVSDSGAGFDPKYSGKMFGVFQRLHSNQDFEGNGVGLAIVKRILNRHGGTIWAEGTPGQGATFRFNIPLMEELP